MLTRRSWLVYGALLAIWLVLIGWQVAEHLRVKRQARAELITSAKDVSSTLALLVRARSFFGTVDPNRLEYALRAMVTPGESHPLSVALLNARGEELASAGAPIDSQRLAEADTENGGAQWDDVTQTVLLMNLVDLGTNTGTNTTIISPPDALRAARFTNSLIGSNLAASGTNMMALSPVANIPPPTNAVIAPATGDQASAGTNTGSTNLMTDDGARRGLRRRGGNPDRPYERPYWMTQDDYGTLLQKKGLHGLVVVVSTKSMLAAIGKDIWLRVFIGLLASMSVAGYALAWGNLSKTSILQIRLVRASEMNSHLKEMNLAAAGLAHETRNPLNIVRGLAQMISRREDASGEIKARAREIINETDRITGQLNDFINYSRPREVRRVAVNINALASEVSRALNYDLEEKRVQLRVNTEPLNIEADEQLLRQALFNLVINAIQVVPSANGEIWIRAGRRNGGAFVEVADNGPGVAPEHRAELFKPYFTTHEEGTGLGLAVVQQIVLAHGWEIECLPNQPAGAVFRITHIKITGRA
jgi:signal transduction histidine kinase